MIHARKQSSATFPYKDKSFIHFVGLLYEDNEPHNDIFVRGI